MTNNKIHFISTGGTLDAYFDPIKEIVMPNKHSSIPKFINMLKLYENYVFSEVCMKDSRNLKTSDRKKIVKAVVNDACKRIIITHGSYTVRDTAVYLKKNLKNNNKVIIFVCSMIPLAEFPSTDAGFNIGYAVAMSQTLPAGIYICMNGRVFSPDEVVKIIAEGRFGSIYTK